jgi:acetyl-CoA carboxylase, biotin carboxylase subunit
MFKKILIANRGEIALRIIRTCQEMNIKTVAVYSTEDHASMHVRIADESICIGNPSPKDSYLNIPAILTAAEITRAEAIHPGVGFLSENAKFAYLVEKHNIKFIGPSSKHITIMSNKILAKKVMKKFGMPVLTDSNKNINNIQEAIRIADKIQYPVIVKASTGGGGKGIKVCYSKKDLQNNFFLSQEESKINFNNDQIFLEKYLEYPKHIEVQILSDSFNNVINLGERDCSLQRRYQKIWEEAPSPTIERKIISKLGKQINNAIRNIGYEGIGTLEFLFENNKFYFIEMNTRIQVEHTVTEMITSIDIIKEQILIAEGNKLRFSQSDIKLRGHSIQCRINAENHYTFTPSSEKVTFYHPPGGIGVRIDSHLYSGYSVPHQYDSMVSKLIVFGNNRKECLLRLKRALDEFIIEGPLTTIPLHQKIMSHNDIQSGTFNISWLQKWLSAQVKTNAV